MRFLECPTLTRLGALLHCLDVGDRVVRGRLELLSTSVEVASEKVLMERIEEELHSSPLFISSSPPPVLLSPLVGHGGVARHRSASRRNSEDERYEWETTELLVNLISTLNQCFPDYEFSSTLTPAMFREEPQLGDVEADINQKLVAVERVVPGFLQQLWDGIKECINLEQCRIYSHVASSSEDPTPLISLFTCNGVGTDKTPVISLSSFFYFFHEPANQKLLFFACACTCKMSSPTWTGIRGEGRGGMLEDEEDSDEVDIGDVFMEASRDRRGKEDDEADSLSDLELPSSACAHA